MPQNVGKQKQPDQKQEYDFRQVMIKSFQIEASATVKIISKNYWFRKFN